MTRTLWPAIAAAALALSTASAALSASVNIIPAPMSVQPVSVADPVTVTNRTVIEVPAHDAEARQVATYLSQLTARTRGLRLKVVTGHRAANAIVLERASTAGQSPEAYSLDVEHGRITISAHTKQGLFYGAVTAWQLMTADAGEGPVTLQPVKIDDAPRFTWRGLMLDSARHYQSPAFIRSLIDTMALHKLNMLQWHLTDDQAWRLEIKAYPRFTKVGAWRVPAGAAAQADIDPRTGRPRLYGGFYTQAQVREIVAYAAARNITIVPEIEMPGHALAAILSYPELGSVKTAPASIESDWGVFPYLYNVDDKTFAVLEAVLTETMALFPSPFIHVGGDEAVKDQWKASPKIQARMKALGVTDEAALQSYFTHRIGAFLTAHGRRLIGWDEILQGGPLPASATVMSWRGISGAIVAAKAGHDTVLSPAPVLYLDNRQSGRPEEPSGRGFVVDLKMVYAFDPIPSVLSDDERKHVLGLQANLWTEHVRTDDHAGYMYFPRAAAVAEVGWSPKSAHDWADFSARVPAMMGRYHALGLAAADSALAVEVHQDTGAAPGQATVALSTQIGLGDIRYTIDGSAPTPASPLYAQPLTLPTPTHLRAAAFRDGQAISGIADTTVDALSVRHKTSQQLKSCAPGLSLNLEDDGPVVGDRAVFLVDIMNPCWIYPQADLTGVSSLSVSAGQVPFNFQIGADLAKVVLHPPHSVDGELEVRLDSCTGEVIASLPLGPVKASTGVTTLTAPLTPRAGRHDLCFTFTSKSVEPMSVINGVQLVPARAGS